MGKGFRVAEPNPTKWRLLSAVWEQFPSLLETCFSSPLVLSLSLSLPLFSLYIIVFPKSNTFSGLSQL